MKKFFRVIIVLLLALFVIFFSVKSEKNAKINYNLTTPEDVVKSYFLALNNKDKKILNSVTDKNSAAFDYKNLRSIKLISIKEDPSTSYYDSDKYYNVKGYEVIYKIKMKFGKDFFDQNGKNKETIIITKNTEYSNWIIREIGEG